jgi:hypothetical protein
MLVDITEPVVQMLGYGLTFTGSATLSAESNLTSALFVIAAGESTMSGESDLVSAAKITASAASSLSSESSLVADGSAVLFASASMSAEVDLTITVKVINAAASIVIGSSDLVATSTRVQFANATLDSDSGLSSTMFVVAPVAGRPMVFSSDLTATVYVPSKYLVLPTIELTYTDNILLKRYPIDNGQALLITGTTGVLETFPAQESIADADYYFRGGATNILDDESEAAVIAAGYGAYIVTE